MKIKAYVLSEEGYPDILVVGTASKYLTDDVGTALFDIYDKYYSSQNLPCDPDKPLKPCVYDTYTDLGDVFIYQDKWHGEMWTIITPVESTVEEQFK